MSGWKKKQVGLGSTKTTYNTGMNATQVIEPHCRLSTGSGWITRLLDRSNRSWPKFIARKEPERNNLPGFKMGFVTGEVPVTAGRISGSSIGARDVLPAL